VLFLTKLHSQNLSKIYKLKVRKQVKNQVKNLKLKIL